MRMFQIDEAGHDCYPGLETIFFDTSVAAVVFQIAVWIPESHRLGRVLAVHSQRMEIFFRSTEDRRIVAITFPLFPASLVVA